MFKLPCWVLTVAQSVWEVVGEGRGGGGCVGGEVASEVRRERAGVCRQRGGTGGGEWFGGSGERRLVKGPGPHLPGATHPQAKDGGFCSSPALPFTTGPLDLGKDRRTLTASKVPQATRPQTGASWSPRCSRSQQSGRRTRARRPRDRDPKAINLVTLRAAQPTGGCGKGGGLRAGAPSYRVPPLQVTHPRRPPKK